MDCLTLRPRYKVDREFAERIRKAIENKVVGYYKEYLKSNPECKANGRDDIEGVTNDGVT